MTNLEKLERDLISLIGRPADLRPFVCCGSPLDCEVFLVGLNPASPMEEDFWGFWRPGLGFDKSKWFEAYKTARSLRPLKLGRTRRNAISNSRRVIERINASLGPIKALETNAYAAATEEFGDLEQEKRITAPFDFLLDRVSPAVIVTHGKDAIAHVRDKKLPVEVIEVKHFSRGWTTKSAIDLGLQIRTLLGR